MFKVIWEDKAIEELKSIPHSQKIMNKIELYLSTSPKEFGRALKNKHKGLFRYRFGDYRVIFTINNLEKVIIITRIGHRSAIYE
jgi:mRNA interferase RelE/StbE